MKQNERCCVTLKIIPLCELLIDIPFSYIMYCLDSEMMCSDKLNVPIHPRGLLLNLPIHSTVLNVPQIS